jgi:carboxylesterase
VFASRAQTVADQAMLGRGETEMFASGRAPAVVAFHGFGGTVAEIRPVLDAVVAAGYAVDAALLPGHGSRVEALQDLTFDDWLVASRARTVAALKQHGSAILLGFSLGSLLALEIASEGLAGVAGVVLLGNALTLAPHSSVPLGLVDRLGIALPDAYLLKPRSGDLVDPRAMGDLLGYDRHPLRSSLEVYRAGRRVKQLVGRVACPALVLHGKRDRVCPWQNATWLAEHLRQGSCPDVSLRLYEKSAHVLACDGERDAVASEVVAFVKRLAPTAAPSR